MLEKSQAVRGLVFVCARNAEPYVERCLHSLAAQRSADFDVLFIDDASSDRTAALARALLQAHFAGRHTLVSSTERKGKARHAFEQLPGRTDADFIAVLDGDDELVDPDILGDLAQAYGDGFDVVWTNFVTDTGVDGGNGPLDPFDSPRSQGWQTSHFFSCRQALLARVPAAYFQDEQGQWLDCACDFAIAYPVLDQTRRYLYLPRTSYRYTTLNPLSHHLQGEPSGSLSSPRQRAAAATVLAKPPLPCWRPVHSHQVAMNHGLAVKLQQVHVDVAQCFARLESLEQQVREAPFVHLAMERLVRSEDIPLGWLRESGAWALDVGLLDHLADTMNRYQHPRVLEFGSGRGSKMLARLVANRGGRLVCVEHDPAWAARTGGEFAAHGLDAHAQVVHRPLVDTEFMGQPGLFYDMGFLAETDAFDIVIVDGPPARTCELARLPALPAVAAHLSAQGFHVYLDDHERAEEQEIVRRWLVAAPELQARALSFGKGVCEITPGA
jgi:predicted O-methyltransferase YrrM